MALALESRLSEPRGRVSLAYRDLSEVTTDIFLQPAAVRILDLSYNLISDFRFLQVLPNLAMLVLDHNNVTSHTSFPFLQNLELLWVNDNQIANLPLFIDNISSTFPSLQYLSMMKNKAAPSYFNGGTKQEYLDYRYYIISQLPRLNVLDDTVVTSIERENAAKLFGPKRINSAVLKKRNMQVKKTESTPLLEDDSL